MTNRAITFRIKFLSIIILLNIILREVFNAINIDLGCFITATLLLGGSLPAEIY